MPTSPIDALRARLLTGRLVASTRRVSTLDVPTRAAMWALYESFYLRVDARSFDADLSEKDHVILVRDAGDGSVQGFTTLRVYRHRGPEGPCVIVFSGDTIIAPRYHGQTALQRAFVRYVMATVVREWRLPVYWFLISKGVRTYLLLSRNFLSYWPRHDAPTPPAMRTLIDELANDRFGAAYQRDLGLVRWQPPGPCLAAGVAPLDPQALARPDVRFFLSVNPGAEEGDELCCLGRVDLAMGANYLKRLVKRTIGQGRSGGGGGHAGA